MHYRVSVCVCVCARWRLTAYLTLIKTKNSTFNKQEFFLSVHPQQVSGVHINIPLNMVIPISFAAVGVVPVHLPIDIGMLPILDTQQLVALLSPLLWDLADFWMNYLTSSYSNQWGLQYKYQYVIYLFI